MKNKMTLIIIIVFVIIFFGFLTYMKMSCIGLWKRQISKIPNEQGDYVKCEYVGFSGLIKKLNFIYVSTVSKNSIPPLEDIYGTRTLNYKSIQPSFIFNYPNLKGYEITAGSNYIKYDIEPSEYAGTTSAYIGWKNIVIKEVETYWDKEKVNKKGVKYKLSEDESTLTFKLSNQGVYLIFDVELPGGYSRKKEITDTIIDSFEEVNG